MSRLVLTHSFPTHRFSDLGDSRFRRKTADSTKGPVACRAPHRRRRSGRAQSGDWVLLYRVPSYVTSGLSFRFYYILDRMHNFSDTAEQILPEIERIGGRLGAAREAVGRSIFGQDTVIEETLITLLAGGHALLVGVQIGRAHV